NRMLPCRHTPSLWSKSAHVAPYPTQTGSMALITQRPPTHVPPVMHSPTPMQSPSAWHSAPSATVVVEVVVVVVVVTTPAGSVEVVTGRPMVVVVVASVASTIVVVVVVSGAHASTAVPHLLHWCSSRA